MIVQGVIENIVINVTNIKGLYLKVKLTDSKNIIGNKLNDFIYVYLQVWGSELNSILNNTNLINQKITVNIYKKSEDLIKNRDEEVLEMDDNVYDVHWLRLEGLNK